MNKKEKALEKLKKKKRKRRKISKGKVDSEVEEGRRQ